MLQRFNYGTAWPARQDIRFQRTDAKVVLAALWQPSAALCCCSCRTASRNAYHRAMITPLQNRQARAATKARLRTESELDQLIIDHVSEVRRLIPTGVDRLSIENRLLEVVGANAILRALLGPRHHLTRLTPALQLLALILTGVVAMCFMLSLSGTADPPGSANGLPPPQPGNELTPTATSKLAPHQPNPYSIAPERSLPTKGVTVLVIPSSH